MNDKELDAAIAKSPSSRRVMREDIDANIKAVNYYPLQGTLTLCIITMANGFNVIGESACIDPVNFNREIGEDVAYKNAYSKLWALEGYAMASRLYDDGVRGEGGPPNDDPATTWLDRLKDEYAQLDERYNKLAAFMDTDQYCDMPFADRLLFSEQSATMNKYRDVLDKRIARADDTPDAIAEQGDRS